MNYDERYDPDARLVERLTGACATCGRHECEDHLPPSPADDHPPPRSRPNGRDQEAEDEQAREARRLIEIGKELDRLRVRLEARRRLEAEERGPILTLPHWRATEYAGRPGPLEIVEGMLWANCITVMPGESGAGKTFATDDLFGAISHGVRWHGRDVRHGSVVKVSFEGTPTLRLQALAKVAGRRLDHLYVVEAREPLSPPRAGDETRSTGELALCAALEALRDELASTGRPPIVAICIDTVRASMTGSEDSSEHVSAYLRVVRRVMAVVPGAACLLVHHAGWQDGDTKRPRERGSSAWRGNVDATVYLEAGAYERETGTCLLTLHTLKVREGEPPPPLRLVRRRVDWGELDDRGRLITSCIIESDQRSQAEVDAEREAEIRAETDAADLALLGAIAKHPDATSQEALRNLLGVRKTAIGETLARITRRGWIAATKSAGKPYTILPAGREALS